MCALVPLSEFVLSIADLHMNRTHIDAIAITIQSLHHCIRSLIALSFYPFTQHVVYLLFYLLNGIAMSPKSSAANWISTKTLSVQNSAQSAAASKLASRVHALRVLAIRKLKTDLIAASGSAKEIAGNLRFTLLNSDEETDFMDEVGGADGEEGRVHSTATGVAPLPYYLRSLTPNSMAMAPTAPKPTADVQSLTLRCPSPMPPIAPMVAEAATPAIDVAEVVCQAPIMTVHQKNPINSKAVSKTHTDFKPRIPLLPIQPQQQSQPPPKPRHPECTKPKPSKPKVSKPVIPTTNPKPIPRRQSSIPQRICSEIAASTNKPKLTPSHAAGTEKVTETKNVKETEVDIAPKRVSEPMSLLTPLNDECTVENSMYPFKLVLSPLEERPLEKGGPCQFWI